MIILMTSVRRRALRMATVLIPLLASCERTEAGSVGGANISSAGRNHYDLINIDSRQLPAQISTPSACDVTIFAESYDIGDSTWTKSDSVTRKCPEGLGSIEESVEQSTGTLRRSGDSIYFMHRDSEESYEVARGIMRGDRLIIGGCQGCGAQRAFRRRSE